MTAIPPALPSDLELDLAAIYAGATQAEAFRAETRKRLAEHGHYVEDRTVWSVTALVRLANHWKRVADDFETLFKASFADCAVLRARLAALETRGAGGGKINLDSGVDVS